MTTTTEKKLLALTSPSTTSSYYLKDRKIVVDYDPLDKTSVASATVLVGVGGRRYKVAGSLEILKPVEPIPVVYQNTVQTYTAKCATGTMGADVTITKSAGTFQSNISIADANIIALNAAKTEAEAKLVCAPVVIQPPSSNIIDVAAKYGIKAGVDNTAGLMRLNADFRGYGRPLVEFDFRNCGTGIIDHTNPRWIEGIDNFICRGLGWTQQKIRCTSGAGSFNTAKAPIFNDGIYWKGNVLNPGYKFKSAGIGSTSIAMIEASTWAIGDRVYLAGFEEQGYGEPVNPRNFEWKVIRNVSGGTIEFTEPLEKHYNELWKDWMMPGFEQPYGNNPGPFGKPRMYKLPTTYPTYAKFIGFDLAQGTQATVERSPIIFKGMEVIYENCSTEENEPSECKKVTFINCRLPVTEPDKNVGVCELIGCDMDGIGGATGIDKLILINNKINGAAKISAREMYFEGNTSTVQSEHNFQPNPEPCNIEKVTIKNNTFSGPKDNKCVEYSGTWVSSTFNPSSVSASELYLVDDGNNQVVIRKLGFGSEVSHSDGSVKGIVKDIIHNGTHFIIQLSNITGTIKGGTWNANRQQKVIDLGGNKSLTGQAIY